MPCDREGARCYLVLVMGKECRRNLRSTGEYLLRHPVQIEPVRSARVGCTQLPERNQKTHSVCTHICHFRSLQKLADEANGAWCAKMRWILVSSHRRKTVTHDDLLHPQIPCVKEIRKLFIYGKTILQCDCNDCLQCPGKMCGGTRTANESTFIGRCINLGDSSRKSRYVQVSST